MQVSKAVFGAVTGVSVGFVMSLCLSLVFLLISIGPVQGFFLIWMKSSATAFALSVPISLIASPLIQAALRSFLRVEE